MDICRIPELPTLNPGNNKVEPQVPKPLIPGLIKHLACVHLKNKLDCNVCRKRLLCSNCIDWIDPYLARNHFDGLCCRCFAQLKPGDIRVKTDRPEILTRDAVFNGGFTNFIHNKVFHSIDCSCAHSCAYRVDLRCIVGNTMIAIEIDEHQHSGYDKLKDEIRYNGIMMVFIRFLKWRSELKSDVLKYIENSDELKEFLDIDETTLIENGQMTESRVDIVALCLVLFDDEVPKSVIGVEFEKKGEFYQMYADKIILSAGTIGSAKILFLSGIGPADHLEELGIEVVQDLPVGKNLQDHITTGMDLIILDKPIGLQVKNIINPLNIYNYLFGDAMDNPISFGGSDLLKRTFQRPT
ncbi:unnamed protein product [Diamesa tonsa]